jgi:hypothetical protein
MESLFSSSLRGLAALALVGLAPWNTAAAQSFAAPSPAAWSNPQAGDVPGPFGHAAFRAVVARDLGRVHDDPSLTVERIEGPVLLPETGLTLWVASVVDGDAAKWTVALDQTGRSVDLAAAQLAERVAGAARRGKLSPALFERLAVAPGSTVAVAAWIDAPDAALARLAHADLVEALDEAGLLDQATADAEQAALAEAVAVEVAEATRGLVAELVARGVTEVHADRQAPLVFFPATVELLTELARDPRVLELELDESVLEPRLSNAYREVRADKLYTSFPTANADAARVAIVEGGRPCAGNFLNIVEFRQAGSNSSHTTGVASCVASSHAVHRGIAQGARIYAANGASMSPGSTFTSGFQSSVDAITWAIGRGCQVMNLSYGAGAPTATVTGFDKYLDYVARVNARVVAIACGNSGAYAGDPGAGFNQVAVGNFDDQNDYNWTGETMASSSSWQNPSTGVETPQLAAPGTGLSMLDCSNGTSYFASGTSFSSPIVAGIAALVIDRQVALGSWPEAVRAILMASAWHNIEGASRLSSKDGAGGADAIAAYRVAGRGKGPGYQYGTLTPASFNASGHYVAQTVYLTAGTKVRGCLSFDSQVQQNSVLGFTWFDSTLASDLDFLVYGPTGSLVTSSSSSLQPFEMVEFTAPTSGNYQFRVRNWSFSGTSEYFGTAVSVISDKGE